MSLLTPDNAVAPRCRGCGERMKPIISLGPCPHCGAGVVPIDKDGEEIL